MLLIPWTCISNSESSYDQACSRGFILAFKKILEWMYFWNFVKPIIHAATQSAIVISHHTQDKEHKKQIDQTAVTHTNSLGSLNQIVASLRSFKHEVMNTMYPHCDYCKYKKSKTSPDVVVHLNYNRREAKQVEHILITTARAKTRL